MRVLVEIEIDRSVDSNFWKKFFDTSPDVEKVVWYGTVSGCEAIDVYHSGTKTTLGFSTPVNLESNFWEACKEFEFPVTTQSI